MKELMEKYVRTEGFPELWCPGCGHGTALNCFIRAVDHLGIEPGDLCALGGIGCSGWIPTFTKFDVIHTPHGRCSAYASGVKAARPEKYVVQFSGDGDLLSIGGNHFIHACRKNIDITIILLNNSIYGMTGGQKAPSTPYRAYTKTSPKGNDEMPFDVFKLAVASGASFFARWTTAHPVQLQKAIEDAMLHKGLSVVEILSQCPTTAGRNIFGTSSPVELLKKYRESSYILKAGESIDAAGDKMPLGTLHVSKRDELCENHQRLREGGWLK